MITSRQRIQYILSAGLLASAAFSAAAQTPSPATGVASSPPAAAQRMDHSRDGHRMERGQERRARHLADLKTKLKLDGTQQAAWSAFADASQPPASPTQSRDPTAARAEFEKLTTPQRLDRMQARQAEHAAQFAKRAEATRAFYAVLTPEQQKTFDAETPRHGQHGQHDRHAGHSARG